MLRLSLNLLVVEPVHSNSVQECDLSVLMDGNGSCMPKKCTGMG